MISDTISSIQTNLENAYDELEDKGATIPANKNIQNLANAIASIQSGGGGENFAKYHIEQTIDGDTSTLAITDYVAQASDNYLVGVIVEGDTQKLYIVEE